MNPSAILHIPGTTDATPLSGKIHVRIRTGRGDFSQVRLIYSCCKFEWWKERQQAEMSCGFTDSDFDYFSVSIPLSDTRFAYIFELIEDNGTVHYYSEEGLTATYRHELAFFTYFQYTSMYDEDMNKVPSWVSSAAAYQIFPERFAIGENRDRPYVNAEWGELPNPKSFYGGDLEGIRQKIPYLKELGVSLIYLNPVFCSPTNHKYDIVDYTHVDPMFGGDEALRRLIDDCHKNGIRIMLDGVFNHCSSKHPFFRDVVEKGRASKYYHWFFIDGDFPSEAKRNYRTFADVGYMPKLNTANPEVIEYFSGVACYWMKEFGADAWRLDVSDELSHRFLRAFREKVLAQNPDAIIIGEDWHDATRYLTGDEYDGVMNYGLTKACLDLLAFGTIDAVTFRDRLVRLYHRQNVAASQKMLNLLDSHDTERFLTRAEGDGRKYRAALAISFFFPGIPCVYSGDEIGLEGGYDPDCRRCFDWNEAHWDKETHDLVRKLMNLKRSSPLSDGEFSVSIADGLLILARKKGDETLTLTLNPTDEPLGGLPAYGLTIASQR